MRISDWSSDVCSSDLNELFMDTVDRIGNPDLKPESTETYNGAIGFAKTFGDVSFSTEAGIFHTDITNRIQSTSGLTPNTYFNNTAVTQIRGLMADRTLAIGQQWSIDRKSVVEGKRVAVRGDRGG